ncbi:hypothetical protein K1719_009582 [Acacia pycnantha]|nr:hypothetical protein K1719_009582 [Acacia pycnantha]
MFEEKERERLVRPFRRMLVVKLIGRQPSYGFMVKNPRQIWQKKGNINIFYPENDFYLVNFQHVDDYMEALIGGPWLHGLRFLDLLAPLFDKQFLLNLGNSIGKAIRLGVHTAQRARGEFARMCIELDLTKPLVPKFNVEGQVLSVVYESLGLLCNKYGWFGHNRDGCDAFHIKNSEEGMEIELGERRRIKLKMMVIRSYGGLYKEPGDKEGIIHEGDISEVVPEKGQRERFHNHQKKYGKNGCIREVSKEAETSRDKNIGSNLEVYKLKEVDMGGEENLYPGEFMENVDMDKRELKIVEEDEDPIESLGMSMVEGCSTPVLVD